MNDIQSQQRAGSAFSPSSLFLQLLLLLDAIAECLTDSKSRDTTLISINNALNNKPTYI